jgi:hypothetical protein
MSIVTGSVASVATSTSAIRLPKRKLSSLARQSGSATPARKTATTTVQIVSRWLSAAVPAAQGTRASIEA